MQFLKSNKGVPIVSIPPIDAKYPIATTPPCVNSPYMTKNDASWRNSHGGAGRAGGAVYSSCFDEPNTSMDVDSNIGHSHSSPPIESNATTMEITEDEGMVGEPSNERVVIKSLVEQQNKRMEK